MELQSPLAQQARPDTFKPKIVGLYETLFQSGDQIEPSEGFWREFFLLKPDAVTLQSILAGISPEDLLSQYENACQQLFIRATSCVRFGEEPTDDIALDTLTVFLENVLTKKYASPSSDIISVLAGLEGVDTIFADFVFALDGAIRDGRTFETRLRAIRVAIVTVAGAYHTGLVSYFINRDLFPSIMKLIQETETLSGGFEAFSLLGLLVNYNKFEFQNPYQLRLEDYINDQIIAKTVRCVSAACLACRDEYTLVQDDQAEGWGLPNPLTYLRWGAKPQTNQKTLTEDEIKVALSELPPFNTIILLATYDFTHANKVFSLTFVSAKDGGDGKPPPFNAFLSFSSYLVQNAHRSRRTAVFACLGMIVLQILIEDPVTAKALCSEDNQSNVRLCRQKPPLLPLARSDRLLIAAVLDVIVDGINHNIRRKLDVELYQLFAGTMLRLVSHLSRSRTRLAYHWYEAWRSLLSLVKFLITYADELKQMPGMDMLVDTLANLLALALATGEAFLPDANSYDDLFYKVLEAGDNLIKLRDSYNLSARPIAYAAVEILISVSSHYKTLLEEQKGKGKKNISPRDVSKIIKDGYDTLSIQTKEGLGNWDKYREADKKGLLKRVAKVAVQDARALIAEKSRQLG